MSAVKDSDRDSLEILLAEYECHPPAKLSKILPELLDEPLMLELVLSSTEAPAAWIRAAFPASPLLLPTALNGHYPRLIARLARVPLLPVLFERDMARDLDDASKDMLAALAALAALADASFASEGGSGAANDAPEDAASAPFAKARQKQGSKKRAHRAAAASSKSALDPKPFKELGVDVPHSQLAADEASVKILAVLKDRFMNMLACLKRPECVAALEKAYLDSAKASDAPTHQKVVGVVAEEPPAVNTVAADPSSTFEAESIKPALYFDNAAPLGPWHILISSRADRDLRSLQREDAKMFSIVLKKIKELSFGHFSDDNQKRLTGRDTAVPIYEAKMTRDTRLVYRVDIISEYGSKDEHQVLSIYGIYKHKELERGDFWTAVGLQLARRGPEYRSRCLYRASPANKNDKVYAPATFPLRSAHIDNDADMDAHAISIPLEDQDELHELLDLEKFVVFSQALLNSIIADIEVTHPFDTSSEEKRIIEHPYSCYVLGRSGTGKTTTMVFRMLGHERAWSIHKDTMRRPRQLFVTQSPMLAGKVEDYFRKLLDSLEISEYKPRELQKHHHVGAEKAPRSILPEADDGSYGSELPQRFSQLQDEHFPLFTTFEKLSRLIEADVDASQQSSVTPEDSSILARRNGKRALVTYQAFRGTYWPHFPEDLTKGLDSALVYSEIMGVVKGSEESLYNERKFLDQETYENFSSRRQSVFASERSRIYAIFSAYERRRIEQGHIDAADRAHAIIRALKKDKGIIGQRVNFLYVDEAQDNLLIDAMVLRMICSNPRGLFWAGDTAQTISVGSSFRFNDLRAFLHRVEEGHTAALGSVGGPLPILDKNPPALFQLLVNYRSHGGIVSCAQAVISLLLKLWPNSIDNLGEERGVVAGAKPVILGDWGDAVARPEQPLFGPGNIEFGARQCIIVRSEEAQMKLKRDAGDIGIVMTVYESKGLEFDDVLLFNFFDDSTVGVNQWRVVLNVLSSGDESLAAPRFDPIRHAGVCAELKSLYVAITRARKKLWIFDRSEKSGPMKAVWTSRDLVETRTGVQKIAVSSTQDEWAVQAKTLFDHKRFLQARHCFERAGKSHMAAVANAFYLETCAYAKPSGGSRTLQEARAAAYATAGGAFLDCAQSAESESTERQRLYFSRAGELFKEAGKPHFPQAAKCFEHANQYIRAATLYRDVTQFDEAVQLIQRHGLVRDAEAAPIITAAKLFYFNCGDTRKGCGLFEREDQAVEYLEARSLDTAQAAVLEMMGRWSDAAEVHVQEGRLLPAAAAYLRSDEPGSARRACAVILNALWAEIALGRKPRPDHEDVLRLQQLISQLCELGQAADIADEIHLFEALIALDNEPQVLGLYIQSLGARRSGGARLASNHLVALHAFLTAVGHKSGEGLEKLGARLDMTLNYVRLLRDQLTDGNAMAKSAVQQAFGFRVYSDRTFILLSGTHLHCQAVRRLELAEVGNGVIIMEDELVSVFKTTLLKLIQHEVDELQVMLEQAPALTEPCLQWFLDCACRRKDCRQEHIATDGDTAGYYNRRVRAHVTIISILATVDGIVDRDTVVFQERTWTRRLYDALRPSTPLLGTPALLDVAYVIPQESRTLSVLHAWIRPHLHTLRVRPENICTYVMQCAWMFRTFNSDMTDAQTVIYGAPIIKDAGYAHRRMSGADRDTNSEFARNRIRMANSDRAPLLLTYMLNGVLSPSIEQRSFLHGVEFFGRVLENGPSVDIGVLCDYFEDLTACLIMSWHLGYTSTVTSAIPHGRPGVARRATTPVTLPRSWCLSALMRGLANRSKSADHLTRLVEYGGRFISMLREPKQEFQALLYHGKPLTVDSPRLPVNLVIGRICVGLCLLAYNFDMSSLRLLVLGITRELRWRSTGTAYESYAKARDWSELSDTVRRSLTGSHLDCMVWVTLGRGLQQGSIPSTPAVTPVLFKTYDDLGQQLRDIVPGRPSRHVTLQALNAQSKVSSTGLSLQGLPKPDIQHMCSSRNFALDDTMTANDSDGEDEPPNVNDQAADHAIAELDTAKHHAAATLIERAFRRRLAGGARDRAHSIFKICLASPWSGSSNSSYYRKLFLGPLPHVLACLHGAETQLHEIKTTLRRKLETAEGHALEQLDDQLTTATRAYKMIQGFRRTLKPESNFHLQQNVLDLKRIVTDIDAFIRGLPAALHKFDLCNLDKDLTMGWRGISAKRRVEPEYENIDPPGEQEMERRATPDQSDTTALS